jgi:hypothetical protein
MLCLWSIVRFPAKNHSGVIAYHAGETGGRAD